MRTKKNQTSIEEAFANSEIRFNGEKVSLLLKKAKSVAATYSQLKKHQFNPFIARLAQAKNKTNAALFNPNDSKYSHTSFFLEKIEKSEDEFDNYLLDKMAKMFQFNRSTKMVYNHIKTNLASDTYELFISEENLRTSNNLKTKTPIQNALLFLAKLKFIAKSQNSNIWFINPKYFSMTNETKFIEVYELILNK